MFSKKEKKKCQILLKKAINHRDYPQLESCTCQVIQYHLNLKIVFKVNLKPNLNPKCLNSNWTQSRRKFIILIYLLLCFTYYAGWFFQNDLRYKDPWIKWTSCHINLFPNEPVVWPTLSAIFFSFFLFMNFTKLIHKLIAEKILNFFKRSWKNIVYFVKDLRNK